MFVRAICLFTAVMTSRAVAFLPFVPFVDSILTVYSIVPFSQLTLAPLFQVLKSLRRELLPLSMSSHFTVVDAPPNLMVRSSLPRFSTSSLRISALIFMVPVRSSWLGLFRTKSIYSSVNHISTCFVAGLYWNLNAGFSLLNLASVPDQTEVLSVLICVFSAGIIILLPSPWRRIASSEILKSAAKL